MKVLHVELKDNVRIVALNNHGSFLNIGDACTPAFGGGKVVSMDYQRSSGALVVRKDCKFKMTVSNKPLEFDVVSIPYDNVKYAYALDDAPVAAVSPAVAAPEPETKSPAKPEQDPPPAKPIQQQGGQQRR